MTLRNVAALLALALPGLACAPFDWSYPDSTSPATAAPVAESLRTGDVAPLYALESAEDVGADESDEAVRALLDPGEPDGGPDGEERVVSWSDHAELAREAHVAGDLDTAGVHLEQAAIQVASLPPRHALRRATFGMRARHAIALAEAGRTAEADALADTLFAEAEETPVVGGPALATLAVSVAERRAAEGGAAPSSLPLLALALGAMEDEPASQERLAFAFRVYGDAMHEGDLPLARRAIATAIRDARRVAPLDRMQAASLLIYQARAALADGEADAAVAAARRASQLFVEADADGSSHGVAEATLAQALATAGDTSGAEALVAVARDRLANDRSLVPHARRQIRAALARTARLSGDLPRARDDYRAGLALPPVQARLDADLIEAMRRELAALDAPPSAPAPAYDDGRADGDAPAQATPAPPPSSDP
ncbi:MAG: hypothetical protein H6748_00605 [Spirochaetaceae bacterium]|nr:hypothetical protein [Spirochaetaceae bacterium]